MDVSIFNHSNVLECYNLNLDFSLNNRGKNIKELKYKIDMLIRTRAARLGSECRNRITDEEKEENGEKKATLKVKIQELERKMQELRDEHSRIMKSEDFYELIHYYIQNARDEYIYSLDVRISKSQEENVEAAEKKIQSYQYACEQLSTIRDVKMYIEEILPFVECIDFSKMNLSHLLEGKKNLDSDYTYRVSMYDNAQLLLDAQTEIDAVRVYSFGVYQYKSNMIDSFIPYEILGVVRKNANGKVDAYSGIMALRKCKEVELTNMHAVGDESKFSFDVNSRFVPNQGRNVNVKYSSPMIPHEMVQFFTKVVVTPPVLDNAMRNNYGYIGSIESTDKVTKYGRYKLVFDEMEIEELIESLSVAMKKEGSIKGIDKALYGNNLASVLLMAKFASMAVGERMEYIEREKNGMTQGDE